VQNVAGVAALAAPGILSLRRNRNGVATVVTETGLTLAEAWLGGRAAKVEARALNGAWVDVSRQCRKNAIPNALVREWAAQTERRLMELRLTL
jgi:hypothetical protein